MTSTMTVAECVTPCRAEGANPDDWFAFPGSELEEAVKSLCRHCPLQHPCAEYALTNGVPYGIFGAMGETDRASAWKQAGGKPTQFQDDLDAALKGAGIWDARGNRSVA